MQDWFSSNIREAVRGRWFFANSKGSASFRAMKAARHTDFTTGRQDYLADAHVSDQKRSMRGSAAEQHGVTAWVLQ